MFNNEVPVK